MVHHHAINKGSLAFVGQLRARSRRRRMTAATASQTGSSEERGKGFELSAVMPGENQWAVDESGSAGRTSL